MKDEDIKLPEIDEAVFQFHGAGEPPKIWDHISELAVSQAGNQASSLADNIDLAITEAMQEYARQAVRMNMPSSKPSEPEPFDLARAMAGEPIVTRDGRKVKFIAYVPELKLADERVLVLVEGDDHVSYSCETGEYMKKEKSKHDLFMAPKPKRTVWVNLYKRTPEEDGVSIEYIESGAFYNKPDALEHKNQSGLVLLAHPIEIDA